MPKLPSVSAQRCLGFFNEKLQQLQGGGVVERKRNPFSEVDITEAEERFRASGKLIYPLLAIGGQPSHPPQWAIEFCIKLHDDVLKNSVYGNGREEMGVALDAVAWFYFDHFAEAFPEGTFAPDDYTPPPLTDAIRHVLVNLRGRDAADLHSENDEMLAIRRAWEKEAEDEIEAVGLLRGIKTTRRLERINQEWGDMHYAGWDARHISRILYREKFGQ